MTDHEEFLNQTMPSGEISKLTQSMMDIPSSKRTQVEMLDTSGTMKLRTKPMMKQPEGGNLTARRVPKQTAYKYGSQTGR